MSALLIKSQPNFTSDEIEMLLSQVQENYQMLLGKFMSAAAKNTAWQAVATVVSSVSGVERSTRKEEVVRPEIK